MTAAPDHADGANDAKGAGESGHSHGTGASSGRLAIALGLTSTFLIAELVGAYWFGSLALLSDAAHMFTDAAALAIALVAVKVGQKQADKQRTYGYRRFEILAAAFNAVLLFVVAAYILYEGVSRFVDPQPVESMGMLVVATIGLIVNFVAMRLLAGGVEKSLNMKGAYLEVWADMLGSIGVIGAAVLIWLTGKTWIDPVVAIAIGLWVLPRTWSLLRDTTHILLQGVPRGIDLDTVRAAMGSVDGVAGVHDLHVWSVAGDDASLTAHIVLTAGADPEALRGAVAAMLGTQFNIQHSTIQTETVACGDEDAIHA
ncbi:MAG: cation transporter [Sphingopyxis sp.]|jgi:cobalt-zinc-cadmium efflux system protein|uniref:cation diffusion facilitator family transporter n=1 Tax=unclassified Sphingopyxis TaxID=2614943 RepID=UPI0010F6ED0B|nr:cation diffusion facilitator family transporter [Sphingopyxis sp. L1A2A]